MKRNGFKKSTFKTANFSCKFIPEIKEEEEKIQDSETQACFVKM